MCFSATASFGAGAFLAVAGIATISKVKSPLQLMFGCIPLFFAIQQISEGFVWLSLSNAAHEHFRNPATYTFLAFAQVIWPAWVPLAVRSLEQDPARKKILSYLSVAGVAVAALLCWRLMFYGAAATIVGCHITYDISSPLALVILISILYFVSVCIPLFISTRRHTILLGIVLLLSLILAKIFFEVQFLSVWCFFSAIISAVIYFMLRSYNHVPARPDLFITKNTHPAGQGH